MWLTSRRLLVVAAACLIAASVGTATETNDKIPSQNIDLLFLDHDYMDRLLSPLLEYLKKVDKELGNFHSDKMHFRNQDASLNGLVEYNGVPTDAFPSPSEIFELSLLDGANKKRISDNDIISSKGGVPAKPTVQKWKFKKGKVGSQKICYFKLCAFRR